MKKLILVTILFFSFASAAYAFDGAQIFFEGQTVWAHKDSGASAVKTLFDDRFHDFRLEMLSSDLFGFTNNIAAAAVAGPGSSLFSFDAGNYGLQGMDMLRWPSDVFNTLKGIFMLMSIFMFIRILFKGGVA